MGLDFLLRLYVGIIGCLCGCDLVDRCKSVVGNPAGALAGVYF